MVARDQVKQGCGKDRLATAIPLNNCNPPDNLDHDAAKWVLVGADLDAIACFERHSSILKRNS